MAKHYWAVRPKAMPDQIRIEHADTARQAQARAFGRTLNPDIWEAKDLGTKISVLHSDKKRIALLRDPSNWVTL